MGRDLKRNGASPRGRRWRAFWLCGTALAGAAMAQPAMADQNWIGATSADWFTGTNWNGGAAPTSTDNVTIDTTISNATEIGGGVAASAQNLTVGQDATGKLAITGGSTLTLFGLTYLGANLESSGTLTIDGAGSRLSTYNNVYVGYGGNGTLALSNGASLSATYLFVANNPGSAGWLTVDGAGSNITLGNDLHVGLSGTGRMTVSNGGTVNASQLILGTDAGGDGTVTVDGTGSTVTPVSYIVVGSNGSGTLNITNGGQVSGGYIYGTSIGDQSGSVGTVNVSGTGSSFLTGQLTIGNNGTGTLNVSNGGQASAGIFYLGNNTGSSGTLAITSGGQVAAGQMYVGYGGTGALTVDGAGSTLEVATALTAGYYGPGTIRISNGGAITAASSSLPSISIGYMGSGALMIDGAGSAMDLAGADLDVGNSGGTGTVTITNGGAATLGTATIGSAGTGTLTVDGAGSQFRADTLTVGGGGTGTMTVSNGGNVATTYAITVAANAGSTGTINIGAAEGQAPAAPGTIIAPGITFGDGTGTLVFNHTSSNYVFDVALTGGGNVNVDAGTTVMTTTQGYTGFTTINGGQLIVTGDISSSAAVLVGSSGTLSGTGRLPFTLLDTGTLAPGVGSATGTLTINDRVMFCACSTYAVKVSAGGSDLVQVVPGGFSNGDAFLAGTVKVSSPNGSYRFGTPYTILTAAGGLNDTTFDSLVLPSSHISGALSYTATDVQLTLTSQLQRIAGLNGNQQAVANAIDGGLNAGGAVGGFGAFFGDTPANFSQASGETATGAQQTTFNAMTQFLGGLLDRRDGGIDVPAPGTTAFAGDGRATTGTPPGRAQNARDALAMFSKAPPRDAFAARWSVWASGFGGTQTTDGNATAGANTTTSRIAGAAVGADYWLSPYTVAGFALAGGGTSFSVAGSGSGRSDLFQAGAFVRHTIGPTYLSAAAAYGWQDITTDRTLTISGVDRLQARFNANAWSGRLEGGTRIATPWFGLTPYAALQATVFDLPAYAEQALAGTNNFALAYGARSITNTRAELGLRADRSWALSDAILTLRGRAAWAHDFNPDRAVTATFQSLPGSSFVVNGAAQAQNAALTSAAVEVKWLNGFSLAASFEGEFSEISRSYGGKGTVRYAW